MIIVMQWLIINNNNNDDDNNNLLIQWQRKTWNSRVLGLLMWAAGMSSILWHSFPARSSLGHLRPKSRSWILTSSMFKYISINRWWLTLNFKYYNSFAHKGKGQAFCEASGNQVVSEQLGQLVYWKLRVESVYHNLFTPLLIINHLNSFLF